MKKLALSTIGICVAFLCLAQSGSNRNLSSFNEVKAQEGIEVYLTKGDEEVARIEAKGIDVEDVLTEVEGDELVIHLEGNNHRNADVKVYVTYRDLQALSASSSASIQVDGQVQASGDFEIDASSSGSVQVDVVDAEEVDVDASSSGDVRLVISAAALDAEVSSAGDITVKGSVDDLDVQASSSGRFNAYELTSKGADVSASSGGSVKITVTEALDASASSGASVRYAGNPGQVDVDSSSGGSVKRS